MENMLYREKYVAFIDMLGFSKLVSDSVDSPEAQQGIIEAIRRLKDTACDVPAIDLVQSYFSDCIVISAIRTPEGLKGMLDSIRIIADNLLVVNVLVRGGLAVGPIYHDSQFMFGPGMLDAYRMESMVTKHPAILVSPEVDSDAVSANLGGLLFQDPAEMDRKYVHYLISYSFYNPTKPRSGMVVLDTQADLIRHYIACRLNADSGSVLEKAQWLERYWNEWVGAAGHLGKVDRVADLKKPDARPFRSRLALLAPRAE